SVGVDEELSAEKPYGGTAGVWGRPEPRGGLPRPEALQRDACLDDRSGGAALSQGAGQGSQALLHGASLMENRKGLVADACLTWAKGRRADAALHMIEPRADRPRPITLAADKATTPRTSPTSCARLTCH